MNVRHATRDDFEALRALWEQWQAEGPPAPAWADTSWEANRPELERALDANTLFLAEDGGTPVGFVSSWLDDRGGRIGDLYVAERDRRHGVGRQLVETVVENLRARGATHLLLEAGRDALAFYERLGFREHSRNLMLPLETRKLAPGRTFGSIHVQTDDQGALERAVRQFVPRLPGGSRGSIVSGPRNGWIAIYDDVCERDPRQLRRLAKELGDRTGGAVLALGVEVGAVVRFVLFERGSVVDEYLSVQEFYGPLPPGDVIALAANPRVVARLTGADPAAVRAAAVHGARPDELPPPEDVLAGIAAAIGIEGAGHGWSDAPDLPGAVRVER